MAISPSNESELNEDLALGPGRRLREARIARNVEIEDVATRLRLHVRTINSIEADDYVNLPVPTFVRGYLRGYARLLDLPCGPIIESYERNDFGPPPLVPDISKREEIKSTDFPVRLVTYFIAGVLVIFVAIWWQSQQSKLDTNETFAPTLFNSGEDSPELAVNPILDESLEATSAENESNSTTIADGIDFTGETSATEPLIDSDSLEAARVEGVAALETVDGEGEAVEIVSTDTEISTAASRPSPAVEEVPIAPGVSRLKIVFSHESWVEIYGRDDKKLYYNLAQSGTTIELTEAAPLRVVLGFAQDVRIEFNGQPFDPAPHTTGGIARFTLEPSETPPAIAESLFLPQPSQQQ